MCGRYNLITDAQALVDFFEVERTLFDVSGFHPRYNIAPNQDVPIVRSTGQGRELTFARWGLVPHWSKEAIPKYSTINARAETVADKPAYREAFRRRRCLIPATGFYEWKQEQGGKMPHNIRAAEGGLLTFAGLWDHWDKEGEGFDSCTIIVSGANPLMQTIHDRMPVILSPEQYGIWLDTQHSDRGCLKALLVPYAGELEAYPVTPRVNSPRHDDVGCVNTFRG